MPAKYHKLSLYSPSISTSGLTPYWDGLPYERYSLMKHGCVESRRVFSQDLASFILTKMDSKMTYRIASSSYLNVPCAANQILHTMLDHYLPHHFISTRFRRKNIIPSDFAKLSVGERIHYSYCLGFDYSLEEVRDQSVIIIDDAFVTGLHERAIWERLHREANELWFFYLVDLSAFPDPTLESSLNRASIRSLTDLLPLLRHSEFTYNNRVLKQLFSSTEEEFRMFLALIPAEEHAVILELALSDCYQNISPTFRKKIDLLRHHSRSGLVT